MQKLKEVDRPGKIWDGTEAAGDVIHNEFGGKETTRGEREWSH